MQRPKIELWNKNSIFSEDTLSDFLNGIAITPDNIGWQKDSPEAVCDDRILGDFEIIYVLGGESRITINNIQYNCHEGDLAIIPPFIKHKIQTPETNPHYNYWVHFDIQPFYLHSQFLSALLPANCYKVHIGVIDELVYLFKQLVQEFESKKPGYMIIINTILTQIVTSILRINNPDGILSRNPGFSLLEEKKIVDKSIEYIQANIAQPILVMDICKQLFISESYLFKCFKKVLSLSPNQCVQLIKIKHAEQLIKTTTLSFKEISDMLGFSSPYYFSNVFKKFYKVSPRDYLYSSNC